MDWNHIFVEAMCGRKWSLKKDKYHYEVIDMKEFKTKKIPNKDYDPNYRTPKMPSYCPIKKGATSPEYICLEKDCPHLALVEATEKDKKLFMKAWWDKWKKESKKMRKKSKKKLKKK